MSVTEPIRATRTAPSLAASAWRRRRLIAAVALAAAALVAFLAVPAYSAFDSIYSLVWGQEILRGELPSFDAYRAPTQHPLWVALSAVLAPFGDGASRLFVGVCVAGFVALVLGFFRLAERVFNEPIAWIAALLLLSRLDYGFFAARAYVDVPFLALVIWAVALEAEKPRRGGIVWPMLIAAGLLRPEAWLLAGAYTLWMGYDAPWAARFRYAAWAAAAPVIWMASDWIVTGDPMYSLNYTTRSALLLGRRVPIEDLPERLLTFLAALTKLPVLLAGVLGVLLAWQLIRPRRRLALPLFLLVFGVFVFLAISARGFAVIDRYLVLSALSITLFAAFTLGGWSVLTGNEGRWRKPWAAGAVVLVLLGAGWTAARFNFDHIDWELRSRQVVHRDLLNLLGDPRVQAARKCGPVTVPNHKLVPDVQFMLDSPESGVKARTSLRDAGRETRGVALFVQGERFVKHPAYGPFDQVRDSALVQVPGPDFERVASGTYLAAYVNCA